MRKSLVSVGPLLAALIAGCAAGAPPANTSTVQTPSERSGSEVIPPPPLETDTTEEGDKQVHEQDSRFGAVAARTSSDTPPGANSDGVITTVTYRALDDHISLAVDLSDDSELNHLIHEHMIRSLRHAEHTIAARALFEMSFSSEFHTPVYFKKNPDLGEVSFGANMKPKRLEMNVWSSTHDSLLTGRRTRSWQIGQYDFEIHASLRELSSGEVVWEGRALAYVHRPEAAKVVPTMVDALIANLGRNVRGVRFPLK